MWIALVTAAVTTALGVVAAFALVRFEFPGKQTLSTLAILPALVPETILGVGLLVLIKAVDQPRTYAAAACWAISCWRCPMSC